FDNTENIVIVGENLEALKLLLKPYFGKVKMIYIDPPYNTGKDFIYRDNFKQPLKDYLEKTGQIDSEGQKLTTNTEASGRYHSDWLNFMYPRLFLARSLLRDDGVIFVSIDDNEVHHLRMIMDEIFGEENFVGMFVWVKKEKGSHLSTTFRDLTEYILVYSKSKTEIGELWGEGAYFDKWQPLIKRINSEKILEFPENYVQTTLENGEYEPGIYGEGETKVELLDKINVVAGIIKNKFKLKARFIWIQKTLDEEIKQGTKVSLSKNLKPSVFRFDQERRFKRPPSLLSKNMKIGTNEDAYDELKSIFEKEKLFDYPKPTTLISYLAKTLSLNDKDFLILDFFAGSGTTGHAVWDLNKE
ncbi:MAG TPA: site-specific DNA-methyltransferase, partial [Caldisericia bacterium]|nr:site-specific DNA-methyltransferase [Caldisericia bacterium]